MDRAALDALNKEMYELSLRHYQTPFQTEVIVPPQQTGITIASSQSTNIQLNSIGAYGVQPPQKDRNNNLLADYQFNHIFSSGSSNPFVGNTSRSEQFLPMDYNSTKDVINQRMSGYSSLARAMAFTGFSGAKGQIKNL